MAFKRPVTPRTLELTSLIDVVFLLLIFFMVTFAYSLTGELSESQEYADVALPETKTQLPVVTDDRLDNLLIQIIPDTSGGQMFRKVFVLWPTFSDTLRISRGQAFSSAIKDSSFAAFPPDILSLAGEEFATLPPCTLITNSIRRYVATDRIYRGNGHPVVEVRAEETTEFKIVNFIMEQCSALQDAIPQIIIRTKS